MGGRGCSGPSSSRCARAASQLLHLFPDFLGMVRVASQGRLVGLQGLRYLPEGGIGVCEVLEDGGIGPRIPDRFLEEGFRLIVMAKTEVDPSQTVEKGR